MKPSALKRSSKGDTYLVAHDVDGADIAFLDVELNFEFERLRPEGGEAGPDEMDVLALGVDHLAHDLRNARRLLGRGLVDESQREGEASASAGPRSSQVPWTEAERWRR